MKAGDAAERVVRNKTGFLVVFLAVLVVRTVIEYRTVAGVAEHLHGARFDSFFKPGIVACVGWLRTQEDVHRVRGLPQESDRYLYQRMSEMLYPLEYRPFLNAASLVPGECVVLPVDLALDRPTRQVFREGEVQVVRVEP